MSASNLVPLPVLLVDDEVHVTEGFEMILNRGGIENTITCNDSREVQAILGGQEIGAVLLDLWMPYVTGEELLSFLKHEYPAVPVILITGVNDVETAVRCMQQGAFDYLVKPVEPTRLLAATRRALEIRELQRDFAEFTQHILSGNLEHPEAFSGIVTQHSVMRTVFQYIETVAPTPRPVLITGETGTGKELVALAIHQASQRKGPFIAVNVAGFDDNMFSDALFGHLRGAFTGADDNRPGLIEKAANGTLFLDEIGDLSLPSQVKLLRLIEQREYLPLGADIPKQSNARLVAATNFDLDNAQRGGKFRKDLYYRLKTHLVHLPPLRERKGDLGLLLDHFLERAADALGKRKPTPPPELVTLLETYDFPGNVRELEGMVFDAVAHHSSRILSMASFKDRIHQPEPLALETPETQGDISSLVVFGDRLPSVRQATDILIQEALRRAKGNQSLAAQLLGISRTTLNKHLHDKG